MSKSRLLTTTPRALHPGRILQLQCQHETPFPRIRTINHRWRNKIRPRLPNSRMIHPKHLIPSFHKRGIQLSIRSIPVHDLRNTQGDRIVLRIVGPRMERLPVGIHEDPHSLFVDVGGHAGLDEQTASDFVLVRVPKLSLFHGELLESRARDYVFDAGEASGVSAGDVDGALDEICGHDAAVVICVQYLTWVSGDEVEAVQEQHDG